MVFSLIGILFCQWLKGTGGVPGPLCLSSVTRYAGDFLGDLPDLLVAAVAVVLSRAGASLTAPAGRVVAVVVAAGRVVVVAGPGCGRPGAVGGHALDGVPAALGAVRVPRPRLGFHHAVGVIPGLVLDALAALGARPRAVVAAALDQVVTRGVVREVGLDAQVAQVVLVRVLRARHLVVAVAGATVGVVDVVVQPAHVPERLPAGAVQLARADRVGHVAVHPVGGVAVLEVAVHAAHPQLGHVLLRLGQDAPGPRHHPCGVVTALVLGQGLDAHDRVRARRPVHARLALARAVKPVDRVGVRRVARRAQERPGAAVTSGAELVDRVDLPLNRLGVDQPGAQAGDHVVLAGPAGDVLAAHQDLPGIHHADPVVGGQVGRHGLGSGLALVPGHPHHAVGAVVGGLVLLCHGHLLGQLPARI